MFKDTPTWHAGIVTNFSPLTLSISASVLQYGESNFFFTFLATFFQNPMRCRWAPVLSSSSRVARVMSSKSRCVPLKTIIDIP